MKTKRFGILLFGAITFLVATADASLNVSYQFNGNGNWSIDAIGSNNTPVGNVDAFVPLGATVQKAFLYSSTLNGIGAPTVNFAGTTYSGAQWTPLGLIVSGGLQAWRTEVTAQIALAVGPGSPVNFSFTVNSESPNTSIDGEVLAVVYSSPTELNRTIAFLDGFSGQTGDSFNLNLATPFTAAQLADPMFDARLSLGIGFGAGGSQFSLVDVNGMRLSSSAGGFDDGQLANGALITAGGLGDSPANPANPLSNSSPDDELYTLTSFLSPGQNQIVVRTQNPSLDDNIFFAGINITATGGVNQPPPPPTGVPESGATFLLLALSVGTLLVVRNKTLVA